MASVMGMQSINADMLAGKVRGAPAGQFYRYHNDHSILLLKVAERLDGERHNYAIGKVDEEIRHRNLKHPSELKDELTHIIGNGSSPECKMNAIMLLRDMVHRKYISADEAKGIVFDYTKERKPETAPLLMLLSEIGDSVSVKYLFECVKAGGFFTDFALTALETIAITNSAQKRPILDYFDHIIGNGVSEDIKENTRWSREHVASISVLEKHVSFKKKEPMAEAHL